MDIGAIILFHPTTMPSFSRRQQEAVSAIGSALCVLTDEILTDLSRVRVLRVISRSSAMRLKGDTRDLAAIGRDLACRYVLEGSVRRAANSVRITARLVDAPYDVQLWADKYGRTLDEVFDIQARVARAIVDALEIRLTPQEAAQIAERPIADVRAQESDLRARSEIWSFPPGSVDRGISHLEAALHLVGDNTVVSRTVPIGRPPRGTRRSRGRWRVPMGAVRGVMHRPDGRGPAVSRPVALTRRA